ncbi:hypothetical protein P691DRAFT_777978 [Macrolepiota fuliginosa MF-IS2]|uniref:Uncharacterized protein n=1 Tax=Macrolepiota fuliginosa MF-IS2 TaxID=1400762 RepID=A0A9P6BZ00_9AGAR|nr:hypothetical protein P691DRAFT_777978 [Macrolepiota fuliginosa MF-IS2]
MLTAVMIGTLTDGLLVWRCYMVQKILMTAQSKIARALSWIMPAFLWVSFIVTGITGTIIFTLAPTPGRLLDLGTVLLTAQLGLNILLNLYSTVFIIARLVLYQRMIRDQIGIPTQGHDTRIAGILLESAAINVPITIIAAVGVAVELPILHLSEY